VLAETEQLLRNTYGFGSLRESSENSAAQKADALLNATGDYARRLAAHPGHAALADATGFSPEGVAEALKGLNRLERKLNLSDWEPSSLFGGTSDSPLPSLIGVMMRIPQIKGALSEISSEGLSHTHIANLTQAWVEGQPIQDIAREYFKNKTDTQAITSTCKAIYKALTNNGPWGLSALCRLSGIDFDKLTPEERRRINSMPAMIYHGVKTENAVLMRMNSVPRSIAEPLGTEFAQKVAAGSGTATVGTARQFLRSLTDRDWERAAPKNAAMSGGDYKEVWTRLSGENWGDAESA